MTIKELIKELEQYPDDLEVWIEAEDCSIDKVEEKVINDAGEIKTAIVLN